MVFVRHFTKTDWCMYAGAVAFDDGFDPFVAEFKLKDGTEVEVIADQNGYELFLSHKAYGFSVKAPFFNSLIAQGILATIIQEFRLATGEEHLTASLEANGWGRLL